MIPMAVEFKIMGMDRVVKEFLRLKWFMEEIGESFFLAGGVCLGLVRDKCLLDDDKDIDGGVLSEDSLYRIVDADNKKFHYYDQAHVVGGVNGKKIWLKKYFGEYCFCVDISAYYVKGDYVFFNRSMGDTWRYKEGRVVWGKKLFDSFEQVTFMGTEFNVPTPVEKFLMTVYGETWRVREHWRDWRYHYCNLYEGWWK